MNKEKIKEYLLEAYLFVSSKVFAINLAKMLGFFLLFVLLTMWLLRCYTNHGESRQVPDFAGLTIKEAKKLAKSKGLKIVVSDSTTFNPEVLPLTVIDQNPNPLSRVKEDRQIYLTVNKSVAYLTDFPTYRGNESLWGKDLEDVRKALKARNLNMKITFRPYPEAPNTVLDFVYQGDTLTDAIKKLDPVKLPAYSIVELIVAETGNGRVEVPNLICSTLSEATFIITERNINQGTITADATVTDRKNAFIWKQVPPYREGQTMKIGEQIDLYLTQNLPKGCDTANNDTPTPSNNNEDGDEDADERNEDSPYQKPKPKPAPEPKPKPSNDNPFFDE